MAIPKLRLTGTYRKGSCPIAFIDYKQNKSSDMVEINNNADEIAENSPTWYTYQKVEASGVTFVPTINISDFPSGHILVSDKYLKNTDKDIETPLFWKHEFKFDHADTSLINGGGIYVYRDDGVQMDRASYMVEYASGLLSSNFSYRGSDPYPWGTGVIDQNGYHRVRILFPESYNFSDRWYEVKYNRSIYGNITTNASEFINPVRIYEDDVDYSCDVSGVVTFAAASGNPIYVKKDRDTNIELLPPMDSTIREGWYVRVKNGSIVQPTGILNPTKNVYTTDWDSDNQPTYIDNSIIMANEPLREVRDRTYQVPYGPINVGVSGYYYPYIPDTLYDGISPTASGDVGFNIYVDGVRIDNSIVEDVQEEHGLIRTRDYIREGDLTISYLKKNDELIITSLDMNPTINHFTAGLGDTGIKDKKIEFFVTPASGPVPSGHVMWSPDTIDGSGYYALDSSVLTAIPSGSMSLGFAYVNTISKDSVEIVDIRRFGGIREEYENKTEETKYYFDLTHWDGKFFPTVSTLVIQIPISVLTTLQSDYYDELGDQVKSRESAFDYITSVIDKYITSGTGYVIVDENKDLWPMQPTR